jgi:type VI secretion system protein ImpJ
MSTSLEPSVLWREGMFLCPQHMQAFSREVSSRIARISSVGSVGSYGIARLTIDEEALERDVFAIQEAEIILRDGTFAVFPDNAAVDQREFAELFSGPELEVWLGICAPKTNVPQIEGGDERTARYQVESRSVFDENMRDAGMDIEFRRFHGRLFFGEEDRSGFECLPIAKIVRRGKPEAKSVLSESFIPPVLLCGASPVLTEALGEVASRVRAQARDLAARVPATASLSSIEKGADLAGFVKLQAVNRSVVSLEQIAALPRLHPLDAWMWLLQTAGDLAVFGEDRVVPEFPPYAHDRLEECFGTALDAVRSLVTAEVAVPYDMVSFGGDPMREGLFECELPAEWIDSQPTYFLGVEVAKPTEEMIGVVGNGVKLVAACDMERVLQGVVPGIGLSFERTPPLAFPRRPDLHFFRIETEGASREAWLKILETRSVVILSALGSLGDVNYHLYVELRS